MNKVIGIIIFILFTVFFLFMAFLLLDQQLENGLSLVHIYKTVITFYNSHKAAFTFWIVLTVCLVILLRARNFIVITEQRYHRMIHDYEIKLAEERIQIQNEKFYKERALNNLDEMTAHYQAAVSEKEQIKQSIQRLKKDHPNILDEIIESYSG